MSNGICIYRGLVHVGLFSSASWVTLDFVSVVSITVNIIILWNDWHYECHYEYY
jgi:hypothetical protein